MTFQVNMPEGWANAALAEMLTKASKTPPGVNDIDHFWCDGVGLDPDFPEEPPFPTMISMKELVFLMASNDSFMEQLKAYAESLPSID